MQSGTSVANDVLNAKCELRNDVWVVLCLRVQYAYELLTPGTYVEVILLCPALCLRFTCEFVTNKISVWFAFVPLQLPCTIDLRSECAASGFAGLLRREHFHSC